jgi:glycosyltransferase involved in cell wall biosynthesis
MIKSADISILIPTYNGAKTIGKTLQSIFDQKYDGNIEVIVVDDHSQDNTLEIVKKYPVTFIVNKANLGLARSVNAGVMKAKNDVICIIHEDIILTDNEWFKKLVPYLQDDTVCVTSPVLLPEEIYATFGFWEKALFSWEVGNEYNKSITPLNYSDGKNDIFRKDVFLKFGGFDGETYRVACEDVDLSKRMQKAGYSVLSVPVPVYHLHSSHATGLSTILFRKNPQLSEGQGVLFRKYRFIGSWNNQIFKTIAIALLFVPSMIIRIMGLVYIAMIILGSTYSAFRRTKELKVLVLLPSIKVLDYILNVWYFWKGFITNKQRK